MDDAYPIEDIDEILPGLLEGRTRVYYHFGRDTDFDLKLIGWLNRVLAQVRRGAEPPHEFLELGHLLDEMRLFKRSEEHTSELQSLMRISYAVFCLNKKKHLLIAFHHSTKLS